jgi:hypothetical protein
VPRLSAHRHRRAAARLQSCLVDTDIEDRTGGDHLAAIGNDHKEPGCILRDLQAGTSFPRLDLRSLSVKRSWRRVSASSVTTDPSATRTRRMPIRSDRRDRHVPRRGHPAPLQLL